MPIYEYLCRGCGAPFEKLVRRFDEGVSCPSCAGTEVDKQLSVFAVASVSGPGPACGDAACAREPGCGAGPCGAGPCGGGACDFPG
jgi:putative FmdB family regulatory protein